MQSSIIFRIQVEHGRTQQLNINEILNINLSPYNYF